MQLRAWFHRSTQTSWWSRFRTKSSVSWLWARPWARQHEVQLEVRFRKTFPQPWPHVRSRFMKSSVSRLWAQQHEVRLEADLKYHFNKRPLASPWLQPHVWPLPKKKGTADIFRSEFTDTITDTSYIIPTWDMTLTSKVTNDVYLWSFLSYVIGALPLILSSLTLTLVHFTTYISKKGKILSELNCT